MAQDLQDFDISGNFDFIKSKSKTFFKKLVRKMMKEHAMNYLLELEVDHSKLDSLVYSKLKLQNYLKTDGIPVHEAKNLFKFRVRVARFKENFGDTYEDKCCPVCKVHLDTQAHSVQCEKVKQEIQIDGNYTDIFKETYTRRKTDCLCWMTS